MKTEVLMLIILSLSAGLTMAVGGLLASVERIHPKWLEDEFRHAVTAFGGGALLSAVALLLVPESIENLSVTSTSLSFLSGGLIFAILDVKTQKSGGSASNLVAMFADFLPEALALGVSFTVGGGAALTVAILIGLQNLPEGFNTYREIVSVGGDGKKVIFSLAALSLLGPLFGLIGYFFLGNMPVILSVIMLFASGGILYLVFQDIAPQAKLDKAWRPALGAVLGFLLGLIGHVITQT